MPRKGSLSLSIVPTARLSRLSPPSTLSEAERSIFLDLVTACPAKQFQKSDMPLLVRYCEANALGDLASSRLRDDGVIVGGRPSPWITVQEKAVRAVVALSMRLRLSPQARQPNNPSRKTPVSYYERMTVDEKD
jgi:phage terminase small subunit